MNENTDKPHLHKAGHAVADEMEKQNPTLDRDDDEITGEAGTFDGYSNRGYDCSKLARIAIASSDELAKAIEAINGALSLLNASTDFPKLDYGDMAHSTIVTPAAKLRAEADEIERRDEIIFKVRKTLTDLRLIQKTGGS